MQKQVNVTFNVDVNDDQSILATIDVLKRVLSDKNDAGGTDTPKTQKKAAKVPQNASGAKSDPYAGAAKRQADAKAKKAADAKAAEEAAGASDTEEAESQEDNKGINIDDIRALLPKKAKAHRDAIKAKLAEFDAQNVSTLPEENYEAFYDFLNGLK